MKKYSRSELFGMCKHGYVQKICEELYNELYTNTNLTPMHSGDKFVMNKLKRNKDRIDASELQLASIVIINHDIPCLVVHRKNDFDRVSISEIRFPFQGEDINSIVYKIYAVRDILDALSYDDTISKPFGYCGMPKMF